MKKFFTIIFISSDGKTKREFNINSLLFRIVMIFIMIFIGVFIVMTVYLGRIYTEAAQKRIVEKRNRELIEEIKKVEKIKENVKYLYVMNEKLRKLLGIDIQNKIIQSHNKDIKNIKIDSMISIEDINKEFVEYPNTWPVKGIISRPFSAEHPAIDIAAVSGAPVVSTISGVVSSLGWDEIFGNYIKIKNKDIEIFYGHLDKIFAEMGQNIKKGEIVGLVGNTGRSTAPHLHYEIMINSILINPKKMLQ